MAAIDIPADLRPAIIAISYYSKRRRVRIHYQARSEARSDVSLADVEQFIVEVRGATKLDFNEYGTTVADDVRQFLRSDHKEFPAVV